MITVINSYPDFCKDLKLSDYLLSLLVTRSIPAITQATPILITLYDSSTSSDSSYRSKLATLLGDCYFRLFQLNNNTEDLLRAIKYSKEATIIINSGPTSKAHVIIEQCLKMSNSDERIRLSQRYAAQKAAGQTPTIEYSRLKITARPPRIPDAQSITNNIFTAMPRHTALRLPVFTRSSTDTNSSIADTIMTLPTLHSPERATDHDFPTAPKSPKKQRLCTDINGDKKMAVSIFSKIKQEEPPTASINPFDTLENYTDGDDLSDLNTLMI
jgi:hypothetical protein